MVSERYAKIENFEILFFELEASGWCGSIRLVEAVFTKVVGNFGNTGKIRKWPPSWKNLEKQQKTYFPVEIRHVLEIFCFLEKHSKMAQPAFRAFGQVWGFGVD